MNCFTVLGIEPTTEKKTIKRAYAAKSREFHPEEHPEEFQRLHDAYEEALAWAERNARREEEPQMPEEPRRMEEESGEDRMENSREKDEKSEESATQSVEPPEQPKDDSEAWDGDWTRQFQNMADASERQGADDREVRKIMEQCISLYLNEKERNKLYHWKDILEEPAYREYFRTKTLWNPGIIFWIPTGCLMRRSGSIFSGLMENYFQLLKQM